MTQTHQFVRKSETTPNACRRCDQDLNDSSKSFGQLVTEPCPNPCGHPAENVGADGFCAACGCFPTRH